MLGGGREELTYGNHHFWLRCEDAALHNGLCRELSLRVGSQVLLELDFGGKALGKL
jgi:hypothetical protein